MTLYSLLVFLGLMFGSFAGAQVWRLRSHQLIEDEAAGEPVDKKELRALQPLTQQSTVSDRSRCLHCQKTLAWYDLLPLISWLSTKGKCRYCNKPIGLFEPLMELGVAASFAASYYFWPFSFDEKGLAVFLLWLLAIVLLAILFAYDMKWFLLPDRVVFSLIGVAVVVSVVKISLAPDVVTAVMSVSGSVLILSGLYLFLWYVSKGRWVGFGDVKLGLGLALLLADWRLALLALFAANLIGSLIVIPGMVLGKVDRKAQVPFGPLLIAGTVIAALLGDTIITLYTGLAF